MSATHRRNPIYSRWTICGILALCAIPLEAAAATPRFPDITGYHFIDRLVLVMDIPSEYESGEPVLVRVDLLDEQGKRIDGAQRRVLPRDRQTSQRFELKPPRISAERLTLRYQYDDRIVDEVLDEILVVRPHETTLSTNTEFFAATKASIHCAVRGVRSSGNTIPLPDATLDIRLGDAKGNVYKLHKGKVGSEGSVDLRVPIPDVPSGKYNLGVRTRSKYREETLVRVVQIKTSHPRILLVTDKPVYQPGQVIHLRTLNVRSLDLTPIAGQKLTFEVEDPRGNTVFKRSLTTSEYGIAATDFQLASEVNEGLYRIRAILGSHQIETTVTVEPYVLPRFKIEWKADKEFYLPRELAKGSLQVEYVFGKPVVEGDVRVQAFALDAKAKPFATWNGKTDERGRATFEVKVPESFEGDALEKGIASIRFDVEVTDVAGHHRTTTRTYPVSSRPIEITLIPEGGRIVPEMKNRVFVATMYPNGSPAQCFVEMWIGDKKTGKAFVAVHTNEAGLAEFTITPTAKQFGPKESENRVTETLAGETQRIRTTSSPLILYVEAKDDDGKDTQLVAKLPSEPFGENIRLRLAKAIYPAGEPIDVRVQTSAGLPTVTVDVVHGEQTVLSKWLAVENGEASAKIDVPTKIYGRLEVHAYHLLPTAEVIRDSRVIYVHPQTVLNVDVRAEKNVFRPGEKSRLRFHVTDGQGKPTPAALGVVVVDDAVNVLRESRSIVANVHYALQKEFLRPTLGRHARQGFDALTSDATLFAKQQQIAQVLLASIRPTVPKRWELRPERERAITFWELLRIVGAQLYYNASAGSFLERNPNTGKWQLESKFLERAYGVEEFLRDPIGTRIPLRRFTELEPGFTVERLSTVATFSRMERLRQTLADYLKTRVESYFEDGKWRIPKALFEDAVRWEKEPRRPLLVDPWGTRFSLIAKPDANNPDAGVLANHELLSAGPDRIFGTKDDLTLPKGYDFLIAIDWWTPNAAAHFAEDERTPPRREPPRFSRFGTIGGMFGGTPSPRSSEENRAPRIDEPVRIREFFPETLLWKPMLVTDENGVATMPISFADSITTWRFAASASSKGGMLGSTSKELRVFQDFFVELDLPVHLTQNDEVEVPLVVHNYLKTPQRVQVELSKGRWFELLGNQGHTRTLDLKPGEVTAVNYRLRAKNVGRFPLTVKAIGSKMSDTVRRTIEVVPDGKKVENLASGLLLETMNEQLLIPEDAVPGASKLFVKIYPGVKSQVLEGTAGMFRLPDG